MNLQPGYRLAAAPHFHLGEDWARRLALGTGLERTAAGLVPRLPWRPAGDDELALLLLDPASPTAREELPDCLCLFVVPGHLRSAFWSLLAEAQEGGEVPADGFDAFVGEMARFLAFKQIPAPAGGVFDLVVSQPGQPAALAVAPVWGLVNLGDDAAAVVFVNLPAGGPPSLDYPPVRVELGPGEGLRLPRGAVLAGSEGLGRELPCVWLVVRRPESAAIEKP
jgi:hypothetical protein